MKNIIQRNLPLTDTYTIHSFSYVPLLDGIGTCCENCGKLIANLVTLKNQSGKFFTVGEDCAETLTIDKSRILFEVQPAFNEGKQFRAKLLKAFKPKETPTRYDIVKAYIYTATSGSKHLVMKTRDGGSNMYLINHFPVTINYIKDLLTD